MSSSRTPFKKRKNKPFDVSPPGQTPPSPSSRPVIITYQPEQDDPMLHREDQIKDLDLTADLSSPDAAETEESDIKHHKVSPAIKKELTVLEKNSPVDGSGIVTISAVEVPEKHSWRLILIISVALVAVVGLVYYYR